MAKIGKLPSEKTLIETFMEQMHSLMLWGTKYHIKRKNMLIGWEESRTASFLRHSEHGKPLMSTRKFRNHTLSSTDGSLVKSTYCFCRGLLRFLILILGSLAHNPL